MKQIKIALVASSLVLLTITACKKQEFAEASVPPPEAHFTYTTGGSYYVQNTPSTVYKIPIGLTSPVATDTKVTVSVSSPTGAVQGVQYILPSPTITIPAGQTLDSLEVKGIFSGYPGTRIDTLIFTITTSDVGISSVSNEYRLVVQKYCTVDITALSGTYTNVMEYNNGAFFFGPYTTNVTPTTPATYGTKDTVRITNFWDEGNPVDIVLDWTDPANFKTTVIDGAFVYNNPTYGPAYAKARGNGTFSSCDQKFVINWSLYVSAGTFSNAFQTILSR